MKPPQIIEALRRIVPLVDTGDKALDDRVTKLLGETCGALAKVDERGRNRTFAAARRIVLRGAQPWIDVLRAAQIVFGDDDAIAAITNRSVRTVQGWHDGRTIPEDAIEALRVATRTTKKPPPNA